jgi:ABC-type antimicrobial peptide transport system permease subunit
VSDSNLLVLAPWAVFIAGVALLVLLAVTRNHGGARRGGRRRGSWRRR